MSVTNGQQADADTFNDAFMSKTADSETTGLVGLSNTAVVASGAAIVNLQRAVNLVMSVLGLSGEGDATGNTYGSNESVADGQSTKVAIGNLDLAIAALAPSLSFVLFTLANNTTADLTSLAFDSASYKTFKIDYYIYRESTGGGANIKGQRGSILGAWNGTAWEIVDGPFTPTDCGVAFTLTGTTTCQIQYTTDNQAGTYNASTSYMTYKIVDQGV